MKKTYFDFNNEIKEGKDILTKYDGKDLLLKNVYFYHGPVTMQYIPYGGIQCVYNYNLIITTKSGFIACDSVIFNGKEYKTKEFVEIFDDLVNVILPC